VGGHAEQLRWMKPWDTVLEWNPPHAKWFVGGQLNVADNCLDRHVEAGHGDQVAYHWEGEPGDTRTITYAELRDEVCRFANALKASGSARATGSTSTCR
jgi:acetyl-CoA synthetase